MAAGLVVLLVPMAVAVLIGLVLIAPIFDLSLDSGWLFRAGLIFLVSALYIAMIFLMGIFVSTRTVHALSSFIALLLIWAGLNFVVPKIAAFVAQSIYRIPSVQEIEMQTAAIRREESEKMVKSFEAYRASNPGKSIPPDVTVKLRRQMDEAIEDRESRLMQSYEAAKQRQVNLAVNLARVSPASAYLFAVAELAGTGIHRHNRFLRFLDQYRKTFRDYFDNLERQRVQIVKDFSHVPNISFSEEPLRSVLARVIPDAGLISALTVLFFASAFFSFIKYDLR